MLHTLCVAAIAIVGVVFGLLLLAIVICIHYACIVARAEMIKEQSGCTEDEAMLQAVNEQHAKLFNAANQNGLPCV